MQNGVITLVLAGCDEQRLHPLAAEQPKALLSVGAVFRVLDFSISNALNSQLRNIYLIPLDKDERVLSYMREAWPQLSKSFRPERGEDLVCLPPESGLPYRGWVDAIAQNLDVIERSRADHVLILSGDVIYQMDYSRLIRQHIERGNDVTVAGNEQRMPHSSIGAYLFRRSVLVHLICRALSRRLELELDKDIVAMAIRSGRGGAYGFAGYQNDLTTIDSYYAAQVDALSGRSQLDLHGDVAWPIRPLCGTKMLQQSRSATHSHVALGARLAVCSVIGSVVSAGVRIDPGAIVENSVILDGNHIGQGAQIRNAIIAENVDVPARAIIGFDEESDSQQYRVTPGGIVVVAPSRSRQTYVPRRCARVATKAHAPMQRGL